jgi:hypothetical protein
LRFKVSSPQDPVQLLSGTIAPLPQNPQPVVSLYSAKCMAREGGQFSSFVNSKADSVAPAPGTYLASLFLPLARTVAINSPERSFGEMPSGFFNTDPTAPIQVAAYSPPILFGKTPDQLDSCRP